MSSQRGNGARKRPQKHQNKTAFKNDLHDTSKVTQMLNNMDISGVCTRCREQIEWRIKYKKYKVLSAPKKCVKCELKAVKKAYTVVCEPCGEHLQVCLKCLQKTELIEKTKFSEQEENDKRQKRQAELRQLSERQRRTFERSLKNGTLADDESTASKSDSEDEATATENRL